MADKIAAAAPLHEDPLAEEALALISALHVSDDPLSAMEAIARWEERSDHHRAVMAHMQRGWQALGNIDANDVRLGETGLDDEAPPSGVRPPIAGGLWRLRPLALTGLVVVLAAGAMAMLTFGAKTSAPQVFATAHGETRTIRLADGSQVTLGAESAVTVAMEGSSRSVTLNRGEALFDVVHDESKPFEVHVAGMIARDVGTTFAIIRRGDAAVVTVAEGVVAASDGRAETRLEAGDRVAYSSQGGFGPVAAIDGTMALAVRNGQLRYYRDSLADVVADANRYGRQRIRIVDERARGLHYSGTLRTDSIDEWAGALPYAFPVTVRVQPNEIVISSAPGKRSEASFPPETP
ncbi:FecR family protein [Novosphingobium sp. CF614]|uniref:FecR family protein n=1 Tax=Novosphingobium sp. CF614 TaxID=1884364 RepID=UPI0008E87397|nr:FecR domain-containing protein [Novosphingobium sp. CF614]SFG35914.1 FecR family protein [Novosphingobium sp. CF614]